MDPVKMVINAAQSETKLRFAKVDLDLLASQFDKNDKVKKRKINGGGNETTAAKAVAENESKIRSALTTVRNDSSLVKHVVPEQLVKAVMFVENNYIAGEGLFGGFFDKTALPMNVNFSVWQEAFEGYNRAHPHVPITNYGVHNDTKMNVLAGTIILSTINAAIDPAITGNQRWALVASIYGNTELTLEAERSIMYGGKVAKVMAERYPLPTRRTELDTTQHAEMDPKAVMKTLGFWKTTIDYSSLTKMQENPDKYPAVEATSPGLHDFIPRQVKPNSRQT